MMDDFAALQSKVLAGISEDLSLSKLTVEQSYFLLSVLKEAKSGAELRSTMKMLARDYSVLKNLLLNERDLGRAAATQNVTDILSRIIKSDPELAKKIMADPSVNNLSLSDIENKFPEIKKYLN